MQPDMNQSLMQDFLTEAGELLEQLDADLVKLEHDPAGKTAAELLNNIFRALHTIKGAAGFLGLPVLITFAHAAEDALNRLRKGDLQVNTTIMDVLLRSVDVLRAMLAQLAADQPMTPGPDALIQKLHAIAQTPEGAAPKIATAAPAPAPAKTAEKPAQNAAAPAAANNTPVNKGVRHLSLPAQKLDLLDYMVSDLRDSAGHIDQALDRLKNPATISDAVDQLSEVGREILKTAEYFDLHSLVALSQLLISISPKLSDLPEASLPEATIRLKAVEQLILDQSSALTEQNELCWSLESFTTHLQLLTAGTPLPPEIISQHENDVKKLLNGEGVYALADEPGVAPAKMATETSAPAPLAKITPETAAAKTAETPANNADSAPTPAAETETANAPKNAPAHVADQTVRVEVSRLESLLNLVGQLVLNKNRVMGLAKRLREQKLPHELKEDFLGTAGDLDRLTSELQVGVMRTRMQPLSKVFDRYPRVIRDLARATNKQIDLKIVGKETEVDKSVLELLSDPLVHILRNSADHGIEIPETRTKIGKPAMGTITLTAEHQGSHVRVEIRDDGHGLDREKISKKAVERGMNTAEQVAAMSDQEIFKFIFAAGFSTAEQVTDLSGRGVGMDVVRTNINKLNGQIMVDSVKDKGTTIEILIPLTVAILPAMLVGVGKQNYAIPLASIIEIVRPEKSALHSVLGKSVMQLRDLVLPLVDMNTRLDEPGGNENRFAVVIAVGQQKTGLLVDRLIGQQEVVIKPMDDRHTAGGPFSGATILEDGSVSLILDCLQLVRQAQLSDKNAA